MNRTRIKFCGMTRLEDALAAAELGVDAVGMLLHSNTPRKISLDLAKKIVESLPPFVTPVGLFVDAPADLILCVSKELQIRHIQLSGNEPPSIIRSMPGLRIIKAVKVLRASLADDLKRWLASPPLTGVLLETGGTKHAGGSGVENDWQAIREAQQAGYFKGLSPIIAAGGFNPGNVAGVIQLLRPWAVDVSSGIESSQGIKSIEKMQAFVDAVRSADSK